MVRHVVQEAQALEQRAATLSEAVERFRLQQGTAVEAVALVERAVALRRMGMPLEQILAGADQPPAAFSRPRHVCVCAGCRQAAIWRLAATRPSAAAVCRMSTAWMAMRC